MLWFCQINIRKTKLLSHDLILSSQVETNEEIKSAFYNTQVTRLA